MSVSGCSYFRRAESASLSWIGPCFRLLLPQLLRRFQAWHHEAPHADCSRTEDELVQSKELVVSLSNKL